MYDWRKMTPREREQTLDSRIAQSRPWHSPPHLRCDIARDYHITAACYEHQDHIGRTFERMDAFARDLYDAAISADAQIYAWCVLPNHYHLLTRCNHLQRLLLSLGQLHGRSSYRWNGDEQERGRKVFHRAADRAIRSDSHFWATINYVHHNPVRHGYVEQWTQWPWSSAKDYLCTLGRAEATRIWKAYPLLAYGDGWD